MKKFSLIGSVQLTSITYVLTSFAGVILYLMIYSLFDISTIGKFSIYQTMIFFGSRIISLGTQFSLMKHNSQNFNDRVNLSYLLTTIFIISTFFVLNISLYQISIFRNFALQVPYIDIAAEVSVAILMFAINGLFKTFFNSYKDFLFYNTSYISRTLFSILFVYLYYLNEFSEFYLIFVLTELFLFFINVSLLAIRFNMYFIKDFKSICSQHIDFIKNSFISSFLTEISFRIDIYCVAVFLGEYYAGIYALIAVIGEGFQGLLYMVRNIVTPNINIESLQKNSYDFQKFIKKIFKTTNIISFTSSLLLLGFILLLSNNVPIINELGLDGTISVGVILIGFSFLSIFKAFESTLLQVGFQGLHTIGLLILALTNVSLNIAFLDAGVVGVSLATVLSHLIFYIFIFYNVYRKFQFNFLKKIIYK
tara:strand:+ start:300 stop:1565 length:1266 start_codon:yes stop_codon:yes gene_type:complete